MDQENGFENELEPEHRVQWFYLSKFDLYDETVIGESKGRSHWRRFSNYDNEALEIKFDEVNRKLITDVNAKNVIVGVSRLHVVNIPTLTLKPLYWASTSSTDTLAVSRGLWVYAESQLPLAAELAEQVETGYQYFLPWRTNWQQKVNRRLSATKTVGGREVHVKPRWYLEPKSANQFIHYEDGYIALLCKGGISSIFTKGTPSKKSNVSGIPIMRHCKENGTEDRKRPLVVSDLFFVVHGIGQKRSESEERYLFTKTCSVFRSLIQRQKVNLRHDPLMREDFEPQVLPVNWRSKIHFDFYHNYISEEVDPDLNLFNLKDIEIESIPSVRRIIGDVMSDIPYYMSHYKGAITKSVVQEINSIYDRWCECNPDFVERKGRCYIIGHSLGSAIVFDILSRQPTFVKEVETLPEISFKFDTTGFFCLGAPVGFFLLLNQASLIPRKGRGTSRFSNNSKYTRKNVPGYYVHEGNDLYGCLAVDCFYNIYNFYDPVALRMNPTVDASYSKGILPTDINPQTNTGLLQLIRKSRSNTDSDLVTHAAAKAVETPDVRSFQAESTDDDSFFELETRDFRRERRALWQLQELNENAQLDYVFVENTGLIKSKYLSMLSAHSSYWRSEPLTRFLVIETGRKFGIANTVQTFRGKHNSRDL